MLHLAPHASATSCPESVARGGHVLRLYTVAWCRSARGHGSRSSVKCDARCWWIRSAAATPTTSIREDDVTMSLATVSKVGGSQLFYLMSRGLTGTRRWRWWCAASSADRQELPMSTRWAQPADRAADGGRGRVYGSRREGIAHNRGRSCFASFDVAFEVPHGRDGSGGSPLPAAWPARRLRAGPPVAPRSRSATAARALYTDRAAAITTRARAACPPLPPKRFRRLTPRLWVPSSATQVVEPVGIRDRAGEARRRL